MHHVMLNEAENLLPAPRFTEMTNIYEFYISRLGRIGLYVGQTSI